MQKQQNYYYQSQQQRYNKSQQFDIESQKTGAQASILDKDKGTGAQAPQKEEEENKKKEGFFSRLCNIFKETNYDEEWMEEEIVKLINQKKKNGRNIKKFIDNICNNNDYLFNKTCEFTEKVNTACEKYFYKQDQKDIIGKRFSVSATKRFKNDHEMNAEEYEQFLIQRRNGTQQEESENIQNTSKNFQNLSGNMKGIQKQFSGQESGNHSVTAKKNQSRFLSNPEQNKSIHKIENSQGDLDLERQGSLRKEVKQDQDDFSLDFSGSVQQTPKQQSEDNEDNDDEEEDDENQEEERKEKEQGDHDDEDLDFSGSDEDPDEDDENEDAESDMDEDGEKKDKRGIWNQIVNKDDQGMHLREFNTELLKGSSFANNKLRQSKSLRYQSALTIKEPLFYEIIKGKVERIRVRDQFKKNVVSFRILDQNIDSYVPEVLNHLTTHLYNSAFFQKIIYSEPSDLTNETDEFKQELIKKLPHETKSLSFDKRAIQLIDFYEDEGEYIKNQLKIVRKDIKEEYGKQELYNIAGKTIQGAQYYDYLKKQKQKVKESKETFKKSFGRFLYHREEDLFYLVYHLFNKQLFYHTDCLDEINRFDKWILVNQGDLEKLKEKKAKKDENALNQEKEVNVDQMKIILQEVDKYLMIVQNVNNQIQNPDRNLPTRSKEKKEFKKKKVKK